MPTYQFTIQRLALLEATIEIEAETLEDAVQDYMMSFPRNFVCQG